MAIIAVLFLVGACGVENGHTDEGTMHSVAGTVERVGHENSSYGHKAKTFIKLIGDHTIYECWAADHAICAVLAPGDTVAMEVGRNDSYESETYVNDIKLR